MVKLNLSTIEDDKPVKLTIELPPALHRDLIAYGEILGREGGKPAIQPARLIGPMLARFIATDRAFLKQRTGANIFMEPKLKPEIQRKSPSKSNDQMPP
jgi:hypothetical protein